MRVAARRLASYPFEQVGWLLVLPGASVCALGYLGMIMAKQKSDLFTGDIFGKNPVGRPRKPDAKTGAQRAKAYRDRHKFNMLICVTRNGNSKDE